MADKTSQATRLNVGNIYDFRWVDKRGSGYVLTPIPISPNASGGHQLNQGVASGIGVPTREILSDQTSTGISGVEKGLSNAATVYGAPFGTAAKGLDVVGKINDGINVVQHFKADRYREGFIELGGAGGQAAGAASGAEIANAAALALNVHPLARVFGVTVFGAGGSYGLGVISKDAVRHFTTPSLPDDLDLTPNVVINGQGYAAVRVEGKVIWHQIHPPEPQDDVAANSDVPGTEPNTSETYTAVTSISQTNQLTDRFLQQHLPPVDYERYRQDMAVLRQTQELLQEKNPPQLVDGEWVRVQVTPSDVPDDPRGDGASVELTPVTSREAWLLNRTREIQNTPGGHPGSPAPGFGPDGAPLNVWQESGGSNPRYIWVQGGDGELVKVIDQRNGQVTEQRLDPGNGQLTLVREFDSLPPASPA